MSELRLNLGAADRHVEGFLCVDIAPPPCGACDAGLTINESILTRRFDLADWWPWPDSSVAEVLASDVCEHIVSKDRCRVNLKSAPRDGRIHFMNELHRVLVPGGRATIETPNAAKGVGYFQDPTHCAPYCLSTFKYFESGAFARERPLGNGMTLGDAYGITARFKVLSLTESRSNGEDAREEVWKIKAIIEAVKL